MSRHPHPAAPPSRKFHNARGSAESELSVLTRQCLGRRIPARQTVAQEATAWSTQRNEAQIGVDWHFTTEDARTRLKRLYPKLAA
jgi:hypothetical protein